MVRNQKAIIRKSNFYPIRFFVGSAPAISDGSQDGLDGQASGRFARQSDEGRPANMAPKI
jgi:hypothetical protein